MPYVPKVCVVCTLCAYMCTYARLLFVFSLLSAGQGMQGMHVRVVQGLGPMALLYDHAGREVETGRLPELQGRACMACKAGGVHGVRFKLDGW